MDQTTFQVLREPDRGNRTKSNMWVLRGGRREAPVVIYHYAPTRSGTFARDWIVDYQGYVQTDGMVAITSLTRWKA